MARYRHLPLWKTAMDLAVPLEHAVRRFPRYHKYTLGSELRRAAQWICRLIVRANDARGAGCCTGGPRRARPTPFCWITP